MTEKIKIASIKVNGIEFEVFEIQLSQTLSTFQTTANGHLIGRSQGTAGALQTLTNAVRDEKIRKYFSQSNKYKEVKKL